MRYRVCYTYEMNDHERNDPGGRVREQMMYAEYDGGVEDVRIH